VRSSYERALRVVRLELAPTSGAPVDTEAHLADLVLNADPQARADLRLHVLAPFEQLRPAAAAKLKETLRSWLLHHGRRDEVAAELFVHPQTVRYRVQQLRDLYGDKLEDPQWVLQLTLALA
jgi:DNA-binding PucR family transcriptional regulator